jgi:hypothetical protein
VFRACEVPEVSCSERVYCTTSLVVSEFCGACARVGLDEGRSAKLLPERQPGKRSVDDLKGLRAENGHSVAFHRLPFFYCFCTFKRPFLAAWRGQLLLVTELITSARLSSLTQKPREWVRHCSFKSSFSDSLYRPLREEVFEQWQSERFSHVDFRCMMVAVAYDAARVFFGQQNTFEIQ